jgi:hypothetical protein
VKRREVREREQTDARERADRHREELIARLRGEGVGPTGQADQVDEPPLAGGGSVQPQEDAMSDKTPKRPPKKKKPKA